MAELEGRIGQWRHGSRLERLLLTNDDPTRYDRKTSSARRPTLLGWTTGDGGGVLLMGRC